MAIFSRLVAPVRSGMNFCGGAKRFVRVRVPTAAPKEHASDTSRFDRYGRLFLGASCTAGIGAMCVYGITGSREMSIGERSLTWSPAVRARIRTTFTYFGLGLASTAGAVLALHRTGVSFRLMQTMSRRPFLSMIVPLGGMFVTNGVNVSIPYRENELNVGKFGLMLLCNGIVAGVIAPLAMLGGPLLLRAAVITGGAMGALSLTAMCAPSQQFLNYGAPLSLCLGGMALATLGSVFLPATGAAAAGFHAFYVYGGLVLFGGLTLYDIQNIVHTAERSPAYDPIAQSLRVYMDAINIFYRIAMMLAGSKRRR